LCTAIQNQSAIDITSDNVNGIIATWKDERSGIYQIYANKLDANGIMQWTNNGVNIANGINPNIVDDNSGGAIITWQDSTSSAGTWNVYAQRVGAGGTKIWGNSVNVAIASGSQSSAKNVSDGNGGSIFVWQDKRISGNLDVYAHRLGWNGIAIGINEYFNSIKNSCFPNPTSELINIKLESATNINQWNIKIVNALGQIVFEENIQGSNQSIINVSSWANGNYFYSIYSNDKKISNGTFIVNSK